MTLDEEEKEKERIKCMERQYHWMLCEHCRDVNKCDDDVRRKRQED